jgi:hypothetical protein
LILSHQQQEAPGIGLAVGSNESVENGAAHRIDHEEHRAILEEGLIAQYQDRACGREVNLLQHLTCLLPGFCQ